MLRLSGWVAGIPPRGGDWNRCVPKALPACSPVLPQGNSSSKGAMFWLRPAGPPLLLYRDAFSFELCKSLPWRCCSSLLQWGKWGLAGPTKIPKMAPPGKGRRDMRPLNPFSLTALHSLVLTRSKDPQESCPRQKEVRQNSVPSELEGDAPLCICRSHAFFWQSPCQKKEKERPA